MDSIFYYILASVAGGIVAEINSKSGVLSRGMRHHFTREATSVVIGVVFGLTTEYVTGNQRFASAVSCMAGVSGYPSLAWIGKLAKGKAEGLFKK